jgi:hypothetical protein
LLSAHLARRLSADYSGLSSSPHVAKFGKLKINPYITLRYEKRFSDYLLSEEVDISVSARNIFLFSTYFVDVSVLSRHL